MSIGYNYKNIPTDIFITNHSRFEAKRTNDDDARYVQPITIQY
jgi:hypothetical protein